jgi:hypothetical protein
MWYRRIASSLAVVFLLLSVPPGRGDNGHGLPPALSLEEVKAKLAAAGDEKKHKADAVVVFELTDVRVRPSGIGSARTHRLVKVLREAALRGQSVQVFPFDPNTNRLELEKIRIHRADGTVEELPLEQKLVQPQPAHGVFWGTQQYVISVPELMVGDAIETLSTMTGFNVAYLGDREAGAGAVEQPPLSVAAPRPGGPQAPPPEGTELSALGQELRPPVDGHWHDEVQFWNSYPVLEKRYTVRVPRDKPLQFGVYNGELKSTLVIDGGDLVYSFEKRDLAPLPGEANMEPWPNVAPKLLLATLPTWEDKSRWLYEVSEPMLEADDAIRSKVAEIIKDCRTDEEKYTALNHWVAENIRYAGTSRGMCEGYTIHDIKETFADRAGVCKDKAGMLAGMLRVAGYDAYITMTMARQRVDPIPADQFNHAVTVVREKDGDLVLLDPTWMPKSRDNWSTLEPLQHVVYGLPTGGGLAQSAYFPPEECAATWIATTQVTDANDLTGRLEFTANGTPETRLRRALSNYPAAERQRLFDESFARISPTARLAKVACMDPVDFSGPIRLTAEFAAEDYVLGDGTRRYLALPLMQTPLGDRTLSDLFGNAGPKERKYGLKLWATRLAKFEETVKLPPGWKVTKQPEPVSIDGPAARLKFDLETRPGELRYACELAIKTWLVPPKDYANFKEVMDKFEELTGHVVTCELEGGHAQN